MALRSVLGSALVVMAGAAALTALAACSYDDQHARLQPAAARYGLFYNDAGPTASLAYGQANSDNVALMLECAKGSGRVQVSDAARTGPVPQIVLASAGAKSPLAARIETAEGPPVLVADATLATPALDGFRRTGRIEVAYGDVRYGVAADGAEQAGVARFFAACGRA
jgi:hypothetical protein